MERITIMVCFKAPGKLKIPLMATRNSARPRALKDFSPKVYDPPVYDKIKKRTWIDAMSKMRQEKLFFIK